MNSPESNKKEKDETPAFCFPWFSTFSAVKVCKSLWSEEESMFMKDFDLQDRE